MSHAGPKGDGHHYYGNQASGSTRAHYGDNYANIVNQYCTAHPTVHTDLASTQTSGNVHWSIVRISQPLFTGREDVLDSIEKTLRAAIEDTTQKQQCRIVISGMGGLGKSEICLQVANRVRQLYWGVFWVDVSTAKTAETDFLNLSQMMGFRVESLVEARQNLANCKHPWLLILDNADDPRTDYGTYIPSGAYGTILLTSRNEACSRHATASHVNLEELTLVEAVQLLMQVTKTDQSHWGRYEEDARTIAKLLGFHPLALIQAATYIMNSADCTFAKYVRIYEKNRLRLLKYNVDQAQSRYRNVYTTFEVSAEMLNDIGTETSKDALQVLSILSMLGQSRLPLSFFNDVWKGAREVEAEPLEDPTSLDMLTQWHKSQIPSLFQIDEEECDSIRVFEAMRVLKESALISLDKVDEGTSVSMHPLVHAWANDRQTRQEQRQSWLAAACMIALPFQFDSLWVLQNRHLQPHLEAIIAQGTSFMFDCGIQVEIARLLLRTCWWFYYAYDHESFNVLINKVLYGLQLPKEVVTRQWVEVYDLYGRCLSASGRHKKAVEVLEQVIEFRKELFDDHLIRLASQHALASAYQDNGQVEEAVALLEHVVNMKEKLAEDHHLRLASQHELARAYWGDERHEEAMTMMRRVVEISQSSLDETHPSRVASESWLEYFEQETASDDAIRNEASSFDQHREGHVGRGIKKGEQTSSCKEPISEGIEPRQDSATNTTKALKTSRFRSLLIRLRGH